MRVGRRLHALGWFAALAFPLVLSAACAESKTSVTQLWKAPYTPPTMRSMIVFAAHMDEANRRALEDSLVAGLVSHDVAATPSYRVFPGEPPETEQARAVVKEAGFEGLLVATLKSQRQQVTYVPGSSGGFWAGYYGPGWGYWDPAYAVTETYVEWDLTLWDARADDRLVWAAALETTNPSAGRDFVKSVTSTVMRLLASQQLIHAKDE